MGLKEQYVILGVKRYIGLAKITSNLWMINLLIMVLSNGHKYIYSEGSATTGL